MGSEARCAVTLGRTRATGAALLETDYVQFKNAEGGGFKIPLRAVQSVCAEDGVLVIAFTEAGKKKTARFELGAGAARWAARIAKPKSRVEKMGIGPGAKVALVGEREGELAVGGAFAREVDEAGATLAAAVSATTTVVVYSPGHDAAALAKVAPLAKKLAPGAALWIVYPKGLKTIREADVLAAGRTAGLTDIKVARFSDLLTALKFVHPRAK
jgi:hypothetical protein